MNPCPKPGCSKAKPNTNLKSEKKGLRQTAVLAGLKERGGKKILRGAETVQRLTGQGGSLRKTSKGNGR